jgi:hypothetical protein
MNLQETAMRRIVLVLVLGLAAIHGSAVSPGVGSSPPTRASRAELPVAAAGFPKPDAALVFAIGLLMAGMGPARSERKHW